MGRHVCVRVGLLLKTAAKGIRYNNDDDNNNDDDDIFESITREIAAVFGGWAWRRRRGHGNFEPTRPWHCGGIRPPNPPENVERILLLLVIPVKVLLFLTSKYEHNNFCIISGILLNYGYPYDVSSVHPGRNPKYRTNIIVPAVRFD